MIDIESQVYTAVANVLKTNYPGITVDSVTTFSPSMFPYVCVEETDSYSVTNTQDTASNENHAHVVYEVNVFSNKASGKKGTCKSILSDIDTVLADLGFTRTAKIPFTSEDASIYRLFARYTAVVGTNENIYRR